MTGGFWQRGVALVAGVVLVAGCATAADTTRDAAAARGAPCAWPMAGFDVARRGVQTCASRIDAHTVGGLEERWFLPTSDVVSATPTVADGVAYVGDWAGHAYAVDLDRGTARWTADLSDPTPVVYAGQITGSAALVDAGGRSLVLFPAGPQVVALDRDDGSVVWRRAVGSHDPSDPADPTEIESGPAIVPAGKVRRDPLALVGFDVHNQPGYEAGVAALDAATGKVVWQWTPPDGKKGCADVWGGPSVDLDAGLVFAGTGNCPGSPRDWGTHSEAIVALDLATGHERWSFQPHGPGNDDLDFAGTPNLFEAAGRDVVGLGNKDGHYYAVDRHSGIGVWEAKPTGPTITRPGSNYSTGGIIGPSTEVDGVVVATSAGDRGPFLHGIDADDGRVLWQQRAADATYAGATGVNDVAFSGGNDFTLRAVDVHTGRVRWSHEMRGVVAAAPAIVGDRVVAVAGLREPGSATRSTSSGIYLFAFDDDPSVATTSTTTTTALDRSPLRLAATHQECVGAPCTIGFQFKKPPAGVSPRITARIDPDPFRLTVDATGLGPPQAWLRADGPNAAAGATVYAVLLSRSDDDALSAGVACLLDRHGHCEVDDLPQRSPTYSRLTVLALRDAHTPPTLADGYDRLVVTHSFDPPLQEVP